MQQDRRQGIAWAFILLLCSHEVLSARPTIQSEHSGTSSDWATVNTGSSGFDGFNLGGMKALSRLEQLVKGVQREVHAWSQAGQTSSLLDLQNHLDRTVLSEGGLAGEAQRGALLEDLATLRAASAKVENMNLFVCKRSHIYGYEEVGIMLPKRKLGNGKFSISCSNKVSLLNSGTVGKSVTGKDEEQIANAIDSLKAITDPKNSHAGAFPIHLSMCTSPDGDCKSQSTHQSGFVDDKSDIFGKDALTRGIPIPERLKEYLPRAKHNPTHLYAVCFDDQNECDGMMWIPKNLHSCSGWFTGQEAHATLSRLRDAVVSGAWGRFWTREGKDIVLPKLEGDVELKSDLANVLGFDEAPTNTRSCPLVELKEKEKQKEIMDVQKTLKLSKDLAQQYEEKKTMIKNRRRQLPYEESKLEKEINALRADADKSRKEEELAFLFSDPSPEEVRNQTIQYEQKAAEAVDALKVLKHRAQQDIAIMEGEKVGIVKAAGKICKDAEEAGEGVDCKMSDASKECLEIAEVCRQFGHALTEPPCRSADQMAELMTVARPDDTESHRRRRRHGSTFLNILFPLYYYHYTPYCYPWYKYHGGSYAYPLYPMPNVGGFTFGLGTFHPGVMAIEAMGHSAIHMGDGLVYVGNAIANGVAGGGWCKLPSRDGDACLIKFIDIIALILVTIVGVLVNKHCTSSEENCNTLSFAGSRLQAKTHKWMRLWTGLEEHVYAELKYGLVFDAKLELQDRCLKELQWGRKWVRKSDENWLIENRTIENSHARTQS